ncbi:putative enterophilin-2L [Toxoplasma gondii RUB]|uniref:Enterophilin-2L, putative n=3 Tax=Toxoplasma gondii TaxID=5811 RepID=V4YUS4_TOXGV|nr:putative enterophilin-2L [Toxoplasma gondii VEG]KFG49663.1 putative enterophilin-2L [Toxoplasma gondii GAB2-2007-GAL-DOM2]KFG65532.1 putative enterophilin-2L [Toxoplasma gondii RUB]CEL74156.1 TPA: enterophilin-2L, putative [Toxoplasma gondii VEG]
MSHNKMLAARPVPNSLKPQDATAVDPSLLYDSPSNVRNKSRQSDEVCGDEIERLSTQTSSASRSRFNQEFPLLRGTPGKNGEHSPRSLSADRHALGAASMTNRKPRVAFETNGRRQRFLNIFEEEGSTETSSVEQGERLAPAAAGPNMAADLPPGEARERRACRRGSHDSFQCVPSKQAKMYLTKAKGGQRGLPIYYSESAATIEMPSTSVDRARKRFPDLHSPSQIPAEESSESEEEDNRLHWKGWRKLLAERQRDLERHMKEQQREISKQEERNVGDAQQVTGRRRKAMKDCSVDPNEVADADEHDEDSVGMRARPAFSKQGRSSLPPAGLTQPDTPCPPQMQQFMGALRMPPAMGPPGAVSPNGPASPGFYGAPFVSPPPFYPGWPPPYYAAAMAAAAAARKAGEKAGMTGQEMIHDLKKTLEETREEMRKNEEEAKKLLEEEKEQHKNEKAALEKELTEMREASEQRARELVGAELKQSELEKQIKMLREEFDILTRVHNELKEQFAHEKEGLVTENKNLATKVEDLENDLSFSKDQLLVARESLIAARAKQQTATQAHEQDLKTLQEYRRENETLKEDVKYLKTLNTSLNEKVQRLISGQGVGNEDDRLYGQSEAAGQGEAPRLRQPCPTSSFSPDAAALQHLFSPQVQQRLLKERQKESLGAMGANTGVKDATFPLPATLQGAASMTSVVPAERHGIPEASSLPSQSPREIFPSTENRGAPRAHRLSSVEMRFLSHLHQRGQTNQLDQQDPFRARLVSFAQTALQRRNSQAEESGTKLHANESPRTMMRRESYLRPPSPNKQGARTSGMPTYQGSVPHPTGTRPQLFPSLPFAEKVPTDCASGTDCPRQVIKDPFSFMPLPSSNRVFSTMSTGSESAFPNLPSPRPYICRAGVSSPREVKPVSARLHGKSPGVCPSTPGTTSFPGSGGTSTLNSARTQWLLQRVSRISRLHGLQNIQEKLKDFPPALLAAANAPSMTLGANENVEKNGGKEETSSTCDDRKGKTGISESNDTCIRTQV